MPASAPTPHAAAANLVAALVYFTLFGFYLCLIVTTAYILRSRRAKISVPVIAIIILFIMTMIMTVTDPICLYHAYVTYPQGPQAYWDMYTESYVDSGIAVLGNFCFAISTIIADAVLVWRMYIVWDRNRYTLILPALTYIVCVPGSFLICGFSVAFVANKANVDRFGPVYVDLTILSLSNAVALSWYTLGMICGRLWYMQKQLRRYNNQPSPYMHVIAVLVESGAMYSLSMLLPLLIAYVPSNFQGYVGTIMFNVCTMTVAIAPTLVVLRLSLGHLQPSDTKDAFSAPRFRRRGADTTEPQRAVQSVQVRTGQASSIMTGAGINFVRPDTRRAGQSISFFEPARGDEDCASLKSAQGAMSVDVEAAEATVQVTVPNSYAQRPV